MDIDITPFLQHPAVQFFGIICACLIMVKGIIVVITEIIRLFLPMIEAVKECTKRWRNGTK